jgi:hypothetical protein
MTKAAGNAKKSFFKSIWLKVIGLILALLLIICLLIYVNLTRVILVLDEYFYEETLVVCTEILGWVAPERQSIELRSFCNVAMLTLAARHENLIKGRDAPAKELALPE